MQQTGSIEVRRKGWHGTEGRNIGTVTERIKSCRKGLSEWKKTSNSNSQEQIRKLRQVLEVKGKKQFPDLQLLPKTQVELEEAYKEEETFWKQKRKNTWLQVGDKNTRVFHGWVETRRMKNRVQSLIDDTGLSTLRKIVRER